jgi:hypothetical protein
VTLSRILTVQVGQHGSASDFTATPATRVFLEPETADVMPRDRARIERNLRREDNANYAETLGVKSLDAIAIGGPFRGVATNDGAALNPLTETEWGHMMATIAGAAPTTPSGAATTVTGDTGGSSTLTVADGTNVPNGSAVLFDTTVSSTSVKHAREVVSGGGTGTLVLDRDWTDGAPGSDAVLYRGLTYSFTPATSKHTHAMIRAEAADWCRDYLGCMSSLTLTVNEGQPVMYSTSWMPTTWTDTAEPDAAFVAPTAGDYVMGINSSLWVGDDKYLLKSCEIDFGHTIVPRSTINGSDGVHGYIVTAKNPVIKGRLYFDPGTGSGGVAFGTLEDSTGNLSANKIMGLTNSSGVAHTAGQVASTYDIAIQVGNTPGGCIYVRAPAATFRGRMVEENGLEMIEFECHPRRAASGAPIRLSVF